MPYILVADDDTSMRQMLTLALTRRGFDVGAAASGAEAVRSIAEKRPDLVLLDSMMPDGSGLDVLKRLKAVPETATIPVIMLTGRCEPGYAAEALSRGATDFMTKPCHPLELAERIRNALPSTN